MTMEMHANGYSENEALTKLGLAAEWERVFGKASRPIVSGIWRSVPGLEKVIL